jgi:hypothetical protein
LAGCASSQRSRAARSLKAIIGRPARSSVMQQFDGSLVSAAIEDCTHPGILSSPRLIAALGDSFGTTLFCAAMACTGSGAISGFAFHS